MQKTRKRPLRLLIFSCFISNVIIAQAKGGVENYNQLNRGSEYIWMPIAHYESKKNTYLEVRYNYEDLNTVSLFGGKKFTGGKLLNYSIAPMLGFSIGDFTGLSLATNVDIEWKNIYFSSQSQYSIATKNINDNFFFSWSEMGFDISDKFFAGMAVQYTQVAKSVEVDPGLVAGINFNNISIPFYVFNPFKSLRYFIVGINYELEFNRKR